MRNSWTECVFQLNNRTPVNTIWKMIKNISGKVQCPAIKQLENKWEHNYQHTRDREYAGRKNCTQSGKNITLEQNSLMMKIYNTQFSVRELLDCLQKAHDTAVGPCDIHYQILKQMPYQTLEVLLDIYNEIWNCGVFPSQWREATIIPIPKQEKFPPILVIAVQLQ